MVLSLYVALITLGQSNPTTLQSLTLWFDRVGEKKKKSDAKVGTWKINGEFYPHVSLAAQRHDNAPRKPVESSKHVIAHLPQASFKADCTRLEKTEEFNAWPRCVMDLRPLAVYGLRVTVVSAAGRFGDR